MWTVSRVGPTILKTREITRRTHAVKRSVDHSCVKDTASITTPSLECSRVRFAILSVSLSLSPESAQFVSLAWRFQWYQLRHVNVACELRGAACFEAAGYIHRDERTGWLNGTRKTYARCSRRSSGHGAWPRCRASCSLTCSSANVNPRTDTNAATGDGSLFFVARCSTTTHPCPT